MAISNSFLYVYQRVIVFSMKNHPVIGVPPQWTPVQRLTPSRMAPSGYVNSLLLKIAHLPSGYD